MRRAWILVATALVCTGCDTSSSAFGPGLELQVRVRRGQLLRGGLATDGGGPAVSQVQRQQPEVTRGDGTVILQGRLAPGGVAVHIQAVGDADHWVLGAKGFDFVVSDELQWKAELEFSYAIQTDEVTVLLQAADANGHLGPVTETTFFVRPDVPPAAMVISLGWDAPMDIDLHVQDGNGIVIGTKNINSYEPPPGQVPPPDEWMQGGFLDFDSNQHCELDLRNRENVIWLAGNPPVGRYRVYANVFSACGQSAANVATTVQYAGEVYVQANSTLYDFDARVQPADGDAPGLLLTEFLVE